MTTNHKTIDNDFDSRSKFNRKNAILISKGTDNNVAINDKNNTHVNKI